jgi:hypothetical protein
MNTSQILTQATARPWLSTYVPNKNNGGVFQIDSLTGAEEFRDRHFWPDICECAVHAPNETARSIIKANAALIVTAVNQFEALRACVDALKLFTETRPPETGNGGLCLCCGMWTPNDHKEAHDHLETCEAELKYVKILNTRKKLRKMLSPPFASSRTAPTECTITTSVRPVTTGVIADIAVAGCRVSGWQ